jgi:ATP-binding protein involved in chromosome partitioning
MIPTEDQIKTALSHVIDPHTEQDLISSRSVKHIQLQGGEVSVDIELGYPANSVVEMVRSKVIEALHTVLGINKIQVSVVSTTRN